ncbi:MAG: hypothetical protein DMF06_08680 [Verrucomicrobia bacterium]|nr:MAG: hypothetical protein DMF06_08680 [Verrucomicrobiota bacterium]
MKLEQLGDGAVAAAQRGEIVITFGGGHWDSFKLGELPQARWGTALAKSQRERIDADRRSVAALAVGEAVQVVRSCHPRHGEKTTEVRRVA